MLDNITALNTDEELINNKIVKAGVGKYSKPAKLSSGKTFREKTKEIMSKVSAQVNTVPDAAPSVEPTQEASPAPAAPTPAATVSVNQTPEVAPPEDVAIELPTSEKVVERAKTANISVVDSGSDDKTITPPRKLKVSKTVVARTGNTLKVLSSITPEPVAEEVQETANEEVQVAPTVAVAPQEESETPDATEQPNFFLGQKLNTEEVTEEVKPETPNEVSKEEPSQAPANPEVTQEEKEDKLNQYLGRNQETPEEDTETLDLSDVLKDLDEYKTASEQIYSGQNEINKLNKDLAEARRILAEKKKEAQQMIVNAKEILESQRNEITSKTQELSDVREAIIRWTELKEKNQNRTVQEEENSLGKVA